MLKHENRPGYKKTKVGWIPEEWGVTALGDREHFLTSGSRGWSRYYSDNGALFIRITNLTRESIDLDYSDCKFVTLPDGGHEGTRTRVEEGDVLISITADLGIIGCFSAASTFPEAYVSQHVALLRFLDRDVNSLFISHQLAASQSQRRFRSMTDQGAKAGLNLPAIRSFPIPLPPLPEQKAIAGVLECWDAGSRGYERKIEIKREIKKGLMQRLLSGKQRLSGFSGKWREVLLGDVAAICTGDKNTQDRSADGKYPFYVRSQTVQRIAGYSYDGIAVLTAGDGVGTGKVFHYFEGKFDYHQRVYKISDFCPQLDPRFFFEFFKENFIRQVRRFSAKGSVDSVRLEMIRDMDIPLPPLPEQKAIAAVLSAADGEIEALETKLELLKEQKRFLLNNLVMGSIRLPEFVGGGGGGGDE
jgi:type I restriction enzyme, S subunit